MKYVCFYILPRMLFWSRLTPILLLLCGGVYLLINYIDTEPTEANIVSAFGGYKTRHSARGAVPGISNIRKLQCKKVAVPEGHLCSVSYDMQPLPSRAPLRMEQVHFIFPVEGKQWGQLLWNKQAQASVADAKELLAGHQFWLLVLYTCVSVLASLALSRTLPRVAWNNPAMHMRATPYIVTAGSSTDSPSDRLTNVIVGGTNAITPAAVVVIFAMALGAAGFYIGGLMVPEALINLRYMGGTERFCLLVCGISWGVVGTRLPMLCIQIACAGLVLAISYAVVVLPVLWLVAGDSPGQTFSKHTEAVEKYFALDNREANLTPRQGFEGYTHLLDW